MSADSLKEHRERSLLPSNRTVGLVVGVVLVVAAGAGVAMLLMSGDNTAEGSAAAELDSVPQDVDGIVYLDENATEDEMVAEIVDGGIQVGWWLADNGTAPSLDQILSTVETDSLEFEGATAYYRSQQNPYVGVVVETGNPDEMVSTVESQVGNFSETDYNGTTVREIEAAEAAQQASLAGGEYELIDVVRQFVGGETTLALSQLDDGTVVLGSRAAVEDAVDVHQGSAEPLDPDSEIRSAHERAERGPIAATINTTTLNTPDLMNVLNEDLAAGVSLVETSGSQVDFVSATYQVRNESLGTIGFKVQVAMDGSGGAGDLMSMFNSRVDNPDEVNNDTPEKIRRVSATKRIKGEKNGKYVDLVVPEIPRTVVGYVGNYVNQYSSGNGPFELVPEQAETWEQFSIDRDSPVLANISNKVNFNRSVSFAKADSEYAATILRLPEGGNRNFTVKEIRRSINADTNRTGAFDYRMNDFGYRHSDAFVTDLEEQPAVTEALSGEIRVVPEWFVFANTRTIVFGTEEAVKDAIDVYRGVAPPHPDAGS